MIWIRSGELIFNSEMVVKIIKNDDAIFLTLADGGQLKFSGNAAEAVWEHFSVLCEITIVPEGDFEIRQT